jgi:UDP-3-O-[3-hydroxymyristoyl] glucosamine N-acyltransferase
MTRDTVRLADLVARFGGEIVGDAGVQVCGIATLRGAGPTDITFITHSKYRAELGATRAAAVIVSEAERHSTSLPRIVCRDPYAYFARVAALLHPPPVVVPQIAATSVISAEAQVPRSAAVGPGCVIERGASLGEGVALGAGCYIGENASIGDGSRLYAHVTVYPQCKLGARAIVHSGVVIGADGFGFAPEGGRWLKIPQTGRVVIGDDVEIGANTTIDRGALEDTVIEDGVKLDNQIQIGHNCRIGAHTAVAGCVGIAGSTTIGSQCMIGGAAMIAGHLAIGDRVVIGGGTWVTRSIDSPGTYLSVIPATESGEWRRTVALLRSLERMSDKIRDLERRLAELEQEQ